MASAGTAAPKAGARRKLPEALEVLAERFDPEVIDVPGGSGRVRLQVEGEGEWDAVIAAGKLKIRRASADAEPDALLSADPASWTRIAADVRGGMDAFRRGRLKVRKNLHLGVGFLAATSGITEPGRLRFDAVETDKGTISTLSAGTGDPVLCIHGLGGTKASFLRPCAGSPTATG